MPLILEVWRYMDDGVSDGYIRKRYHSIIMSVHSLSRRANLLCWHGWYGFQYIYRGMPDLVISLQPVIDWWFQIIPRLVPSHDDVIKWKHYPRYWPFARGIHRYPLNSPRKGHWRGAFMFSLIFAWTNGWVNTRNAGDLRPCMVINSFL